MPARRSASNWDGNSATGESAAAGGCWSNRANTCAPAEETNAPDLAWWSPERAALIPPRSERRGYPRVLPTFVLEELSYGQSRAAQQRKMENWIRRGVIVGWLLDVHGETLTVFRRKAGAGDPPQVEMTVHQKPNAMRVGDEMPGLEVDLREIWTWKDL